MLDEGRMATATERASTQRRAVEPKSVDPEVVDLMTSLGLQEYLACLGENDFVDMEAVLLMENMHMDAMGVSLAHRLKLNRKLKNLRDTEVEIEQKHDDRLSHQELRWKVQGFSKDAMQVQSKGEVDTVQRKAEIEHKTPDEVSREECAPLRTGRGKRKRVVHRKKGRESTALRKKTK